MEQATARSEMLYAIILEEGIMTQRYTLHAFYPPRGVESLTNSAMLLAAKDIRPFAIKITGKLFKAVLYKAEVAWSFQICGPFALI